MITPREIQEAVEAVENFEHIPITEPNRIATSPAVGESDEAPKGLGTPGYKPLMQNRKGHDVARSDRDIAGESFSFRQAACDWLTIYDLSPEGPLKQLAKRMMCVNHNEASRRDL